MSVDFTKLPIGTKVIGVKGNGEIINIDKTSLYSIRVSYPCGYADYLSDGRYYDSDVLPSLFVDDGKFQWPEQSQPLPQLEVDTKVWVKYNDNDCWKPRHFSNWGNDGKMYVFVNGLSSFTSYDAWRRPVEHYHIGEDKPV